MGKIDIEQAKKRLQNSSTELFGYSKNKSDEVESDSVDEIEFIDSVNDNMFVFKKGEKFILSPADDYLDPIIGEFDDIPEDGSMPPCLQDWLDTYSKEIKFFQDNEVELLAEYNDNTVYGTSIEFVDLGLSVNWANTNLGANKPEEIGSYYAWGETTVKSKYTKSNYKFYVNKNYVNIGKGIAKTEYDAAFKFDNNLCLPTEEQWIELQTKCKFKETKINGVTGYEVTGPSGKTIFLPFGGCTFDSSKAVPNSQGYYMLSEQSETNYQERCGKIGIDSLNTIVDIRKRTGISIRPVSVKENDLNSKKTINPLIPFMWGQSAPYNNLLETDPATNKLFVTGCSNTAMSMIIAYYGCIGINGKKFKRGCLKTSTYVSKKSTSSELNIPALPSLALFDYDNLNFVKSADFKTSASKNAVAQLMKYVGHASKANYSSSGTGTSVSNSLSFAKKYLNFGSQAKIIYASSGLEEFKDQIYEELINGYPVNFYGWNSKGTSGHAFICDGYDAKTGKFHFNWGWNGSYNGWFDIALLQPTSSNDFSYSKRCIVGLHPEYMFGDLNNDNNINITDIMGLVQAIIDKKAYKVQNDINSDGKVNEQDIKDLVDYIIGNKI